jgi:signal transduction histidine kinase
VQVEHVTKTNCWEYWGCKHGPESSAPCPVTRDRTSDGVNGGTNAGRICWTVSSTPCFWESTPDFIEKREICFGCDFFLRVRNEEGVDFQLFKLAQGVSASRQLHHTISQVEHFLSIHGRLLSRFDLPATLKDITAEVQNVTGARRSVIFLVEGFPPRLHGEFPLRGKLRQVDIEIDDNSIVGRAAARNQVVNVRIEDEKNPEGSGFSGHDNSGEPEPPKFNDTFDRQLDCRTQSLIAVPVQSSEGKVIGVITAANTGKGFFSSDDEWFMRMYATEAALALEKQECLQLSCSTLRLAAIGETIAGLSHCIKNIAHALRGSSYVVKRALNTGNLPNVQTAWDILDRHIESLANLSIDVLTYDPGASRRVEGHGLNDMVNHVADLFREEARARAVTIEVAADERVDSASFDARGMYRCLVNLLTNALDACPLCDGVVTIRTGRPADRELMVEVSDNGMGMDETTREGMFDVFKSSKPGKGSGLGLPTVADFVRENQGRMEIDTAPGQGTSFRIYIKEPC